MAGRAFTGKTIKLETTEAHRLFLSSLYAELYPTGTDGPGLPLFYHDQFIQAMDEFIGDRLDELRKKAAESERAKLQAEAEKAAAEAAARAEKLAALEALLDDLDDD